MVSPNNPTGSYLKVDELAEVSAHLPAVRLRAHRGRGVLRLRQEGGRGTAWRARWSNSSALTFVLNGFSKVVGLPQLKLSWIHVGGPEEPSAESLGRAGAHLGRVPLRRRARAARARPGSCRCGGPSRSRSAAAWSATVACSPPPCPRVPVGCWTARAAGTRWWACRKRLPEEELVFRLLEQEGVLAHPGYFYDFPTGSFLVLSLLTPPEVFGEGVDGSRQGAASRPNCIFVDI